MTSFFYVVSIAYHTSVQAPRKCMDTSRKKKPFGWERSHSCTACCTSSSDLKDLPPIAPLSGPKPWKSLEARSGEYGGCGRHSKDISWIVATVERAVWGRALLCCNKTPALRSPRPLGLIAGYRWLFKRHAYVTLFSVPLGHVVLQDYTSFIPKDCQHNLSCIWLCAWPGRGDSVTELVPFMNF